MLKALIIIVVGVAILFLALVAWLGITLVIQGKMTGGMTRWQAWKDIGREIWCFLTGQPFPR